jgi:hypothetical protein
MLRNHHRAKSIHDRVRNSLLNYLVRWASGYAENHQEAPAIHASNCALSLPDSELSTIRVVPADISEILRGSGWVNLRPILREPLRLVGAH